MPEQGVLVRWYDHRSNDAGEATGILCSDGIPLVGHGRGTDLLLGIEPLTDFGDLAALQVPDLLQEFLD